MRAYWFPSPTCFPSRFQDAELVSRIGVEEEVRSVEGSCSERRGGSARAFPRLTERITLPRLSRVEIRTHCVADTFYEYQGNDRQVERTYFFLQQRGNQNFSRTMLWLLFESSHVVSMARRTALVIHTLRNATVGGHFGH